MIGVEGVEHAQADAGLDDRADGLGMEHLGAGIGQLGYLAIGEFLDGGGVRDDARIGGHHPVHVGPDPDLVGGQGRADQRGGVVAAAAAQGGGDPGVRGAEETGHDRDDAFVQDWVQNGAGGLLGGREIGMGGEELVVGDDQPRGLDVLRRGARGVHHRGQQAHRHALAQGGHRVQGARGGLAQHRDGLAQVGKIEDEQGDLLRTSSWRTRSVMSAFRMASCLLRRVRTACL